MPQRNVATNFTFEQQRQEINLVAQDHWSFYSSQTTANATFLKVDGSNGFTGANLSVPNAFTINANSGNGTVTISGNLDVTGTTTTVSSANLEVTDKNILIAKGSTSDAQADGAGITIDSATDITFNFVDAKDALVSSIGLEASTSLKSNTLVVAGLGNIGGGHFTGNYTPTTGSGVEVFAPDANTGQISSFNRGTSTWNPLRIKGASVPIYTGTSNALVGTFNSTGLTMETGKTITGVLATAGQTNITSVGTLTGLSQTGQYNLGTFQNNDGINMGDSGYFQLRSDSRPATGQAISIYSGGTTGTALKAAIFHNGGATFAGVVDIGGSVNLNDTTVDLYSQTTNAASKTFQLFSDIGGTKTEHAFIKADGEASFGNPGGVLGANLNNSVSGHFFVSQCDDNNDGFEIYQQHGSTSTRNTLAVYANTGTSGAKKEQFIVRGDGNVVVGGGTTVGGAGTFSMEENGHVRSILTAATAGDTLFGAISGVSNGFQINIDTSNNQDYIFHNGSQVTLKIDNSGQVQIGGDGGQGQNPLLVSGNYAGSASVDIQTWQRVGGAVQAKMIYRDATTDMVFGTDTAHDLEIMTAGVPRMTVQSTGEIVVGSHSISDEQFKIKGGEADLWLDSSGTGVWRILGSTGGSTHQFRVYDNEGGGDRLTIGSTGRVRLSGVPGVAGSNLANVSIESDGNLCTTTSLRKYKTNISSLEDTSWLFNLNPVTFDWKKKTEEDGVTTWEDTPDGNGTQYGLIAEEVEEVKDDFCYYDNDGKLTGVHYDRLIAPLLKVVQQQKEEIEALKARVANLES